MVKLYYCVLEATEGIHANRTGLLGFDPRLDALSDTKSGLRRVRNSCMLVLRLCSVIAASQHVVDTRQIHDFMKIVWPQAYE